MAHHVDSSAYGRLVDRLNRFPQGAPPSELLHEILRMLFSEREADLVALLPIKPFSAEKAARCWSMSVLQARKMLDELASRAVLVDVEQNGEMVYSLPPPMAGFFEFSMMRVRGDIDQKLLSELFYQYIDVEEDFIRCLFTRGETQLGRTFVLEPSLSMENALHVLDYERSSEVIRSASHRGISMCYCRHKMSHLERECDAPMHICMTFNNAAQSLTRHGHAREVGVEECLDLLAEAHAHRLVQFGENVREKVSFICNCCGCCCEAMIAARRFAILNPVHTTSFLPEVDTVRCSGCGKCVQACPVEALTLLSTNDSSKPRAYRARIDEGLCLGCGVCVGVCSVSALSLKSRAKRVLTPLNGAHRAVMMAIERGMLQHLIFDNRVMWSHRAMAAVLGVLLRLPPIKQALATEQVKSRYIEALIKRMS